MIPILGFTPDLDATTPGALPEVTGMVPTKRGMKAAPSATSVGIAALAAECRGAALVRNIAGTSTLYAGTAAGLYKAATTTWTDVSAAAYSLGTDDRWSFAQYGNDTLAATISKKIQKATTGVYAEIAAAPKAQIVLSVYGFVIALHTDEVTYGDAPDRWWCSAFLDNTDWTPAVSTQSTTGRIVEGGGGFTAGATFGDDWVAFKSRSIFHARYQGAPAVWQPTAVPGAYGCVGQEAVIDIGGALAVAGEDDIYLYDGVRPQSIAANHVKRWYAANLSQTYRYRTKLMWDRANAMLWVYFPSTSSTGNCDTALAFSMERQAWGKAAQTIEAVVLYKSPAITYDGGSALLTTYDGSPGIPYDSPFWVSGAETAAVFNTSHVLSTLSGAAGSGSFTTWDFGDEDTDTYLDKLGVRFNAAPSAATATGYIRDDLGVMKTASNSAIRDDGSFDMRQSARWHCVTVATTGECEFSAVRPRLKAAGRR